MAATFIPINDQTTLGRNMVRALSLLREGLETFQHARATFVTMTDGGVDDASKFTLPLLAGANGAYPDNTTAKASWDEIDSLNSLLPAATILQACAKHGIGG